MSDAPLIFYRAAAVRDAMHVMESPGVVAVRDRRIVVAGDETSVRREAGKPDRVVELPGMLLLPGMMNGHAHLDLTHLPRVPYEGRFFDWLKSIIDSRPLEDRAITAAVRDGLRMSRASGVSGLADIAGSLAAVKARLDAGVNEHVAGISFLEVLGFSARGRDAAKAGLHAMQMLCPTESPASASPQSVAVTVDLALQPHAPYSTGLPAYEFAATECDIASTHLAETLEEAQFIREASGPFADLLRRLGKWDDTISPQGKSPVRYLAPILGRSNCSWILAHCNHVDDADIAILAGTNLTVAYCPVASDYFQHRGHRYRDMLAAGVNVCLGTDSIICQPVGEPQPLGILPQMRHLYQRDQTDPLTLLEMATMRGCVAGGYRSMANLSPGEPADFFGVRFDPDDSTDPLEQALLNHEPAVGLDTDGHL